MNREKKDGNFQVFTGELGSGVTLLKFWKDFFYNEAIVKEKFEMFLCDSSKKNFGGL